MLALTRLNVILLVALLAVACDQRRGQVYAASGEPSDMSGSRPFRESVIGRSKHDQVDAVEPRKRRYPRLPDDDSSGGFEEPIIDIAIAEVGMKSVFRFRAREADGKVYDPTIKSIELWKKGEKDLTCELRSGGVRLKEWRYGELPSGFDSPRCIPLTAGAYELNVRGLGGSGRIQVRVDERGHARALPWYGQSRLPWDGR